MAFIDRFLKEARIGRKTSLVVGPKEIIGTITALDADAVTIRREDGKTAVADLSAISFFEFEEAETPAAPKAAQVSEPAEEEPAPEEPVTAEPAESESISEETPEPKEEFKLPDTSFLDRYLKTNEPPETPEENEASAEPAEEEPAESEEPEEPSEAESAEETPEASAEPEEETPEEAAPEEHVLTGEEAIELFNPERMIRRNTRDEEALIEDIPSFSMDLYETEIKNPVPEKSSEEPEDVSDSAEQTPETAEAAKPEADTPEEEPDDMKERLQDMVQEPDKDKAADAEQKPDTETSGSVYAAPKIVLNEDQEPVMVLPETEESSETEEEKEEDLTDFERAIVEGSIPSINVLLDMPERLQAEGLSAADLKRCRNVLKSHTLRPGSDPYSIGCRLDQLQGNLHGTAETYFRKAISDPENTANMDKALRRLQMYCIKDRDYVMYTELYDEYRQWITFPTSSELLFHATAYDTVRGNGPEMLEGIPVQFSSETDYLVMIRYLKNHPDAGWLYQSIRSRLLEDVSYVKASEQLLEFIHDNKPSEEFEQERIRFFLHLKETNTLNRLEKLMAAGHEVKETVSVYSEQNGALAEEAQPREPKDIISDFLEDKEFGVLRAKAYLTRTEHPLTLLDDAVLEIHNNAQTDWTAAAESGDPLAQEFLKAVYTETGMSDEAIEALSRTAEDDNVIREALSEETE